MTTRFDWDPGKDLANQQKHGVGFAEAQFAFADPHRVIAEELSHGGAERRGATFALAGSDPGF